MKPSGTRVQIGMGGGGGGRGEWIRPCGPAHSCDEEIWPATPANLPLTPHPPTPIPLPRSIGP